MNGDDHEKLLNVSDMAQAVGLSRDRFYDLVRAGIFPPPVYDIVTRRPRYAAEQQRACLAVRSSGVGFNGKRILFNRTKRSRARRRHARAPNGVEHRAASRIEQLARQLAHFGVRDVSVPAVERAMQCCFPAGIEGVEDAEVVQRLCQHLWKNPDAA